MIDHSFSEEHQMFRKTLKEFCKKHLIPKGREIDDKAEIPREVIKGIAELGLFGVNVSPEYGGAGADFMSTIIGGEELGYADISLSIAVFPYLVENAFGFIVDRYGSAKLKEEVLPRATKGEIFIGIAATEPGSGLDVAAMESTAAKQDGGYVLNGEKAYITGITEIKQHGGGYVTLVKTEPEKDYRGMTLFFVPLLQGTTTTLYEEVGKRGCSYGGFTMESLKLPSHYVIGEENKGFTYAMEGITRARLIMSAACVGAAQRALDIGMDYIKQRKAFDKPIGKYEGIQFQLADDYTQLELSRMLLYKAAWMVDKMQEEKRFTQAEVGTAAAMVKLYAPATAFNIFNHALLWYGAYGYTKECLLEVGLRGVLSITIGAGGTDNAMRLGIARSLLGKEFGEAV